MQSFLLACATMLLVSVAVALPLPGNVQEASSGSVFVSMSTEATSPARSKVLVAEIDVSSGKTLHTAEVSDDTLSPRLFHGGINKFVAIDTNFGHPDHPVSSVYTIDPRTGETKTVVAATTVWDEIKSTVSCMSEYDQDSMLIMVEHSPVRYDELFAYYVVDLTGSGRITLLASVAKQGKLDINNYEPGCIKAPDDTIALVSTDPQSQDWAGAFQVQVGGSVNATVSFARKPADYGVERVFGVDPSSGLLLSFKEDTRNKLIVAWNASDTGPTKLVAELPQECEHATYGQGYDNFVFYDSRPATQSHYVYVSCVQEDAGLGDVGALTVARVDLATGKTVVSYWDPVLMSKDRSIIAVGPAN